MGGKKDSPGSRMGAVIRKLKAEYPAAETALRHSDPLELLVATILSAQCTDERVNAVTKGLFKHYRSANDYASADRKEFEKEIYSTGFYRAKAKNIIACGAALVDKFAGKVPESMEELVTLPGVGRKTANVVLGSAFGRTEGIVVDTHVKRLADRLGFSRKADPDIVEEDLMKLVPRGEWIVFPHLLILHGRNVCHARKPSCPECVINPLCPSAGKF